MDQYSYWGSTFFSFFRIAFEHIVLALQGKYSLSDMPSDEMQMIILALIGISCSLVGCFLLLRKMAMVANAISHTVLVGIVASFLILKYVFHHGQGELLTIDMKMLMMSAFISSLLTIVLTEFLHKTLKLGKDASIGLAFTTLFAVGIMGVTIFTRNTHIGAEIIMGNADLLHLDDLMLALFLALTNILVVVVCYKEYVITSFDPDFARLIKTPGRMINYFIIFQTSATLIAAFRAVGVVLVLALIVLPPVTARMLTGRLKSMIFISCGLSILSSVFSVALGRHLLTTYDIALSTSGLIVTVSFIIWVGVVSSIQLKSIWIRTRLRGQKTASYDLT